ncbi:MAG: divalent-cation tolerance protein CutA [Candidatus Obscuribacterales bacterium]|nr:divalent-cation tolerance protein CutA [Candidatus Obscuribacterales bacterium]
MSEAVVGFCTCPQGKGQEIAAQLVSEKLAACVNIIPSIQSIYIWNGKLENELEELLVIKSEKESWKALEKRIKEIHPYELPEIICFRVEDGYAPYLEWLKSSLKT